MSIKETKKILKVALNVQKDINEIVKGSEKEEELCSYCGKGFEGERGIFCVVIDGEVKRVHKVCYKRHQSKGKVNISIKVK